MTDPQGPDPEPNPFGDLAAGLNQIFQLFGMGGAPGAAGVDWARAREAAAAMAAAEAGPAGESNVDPLVRMQFEQLARVAELHVGQVTGLTLAHGGAGLTLAPVNRSQWATRTVDDYRPLFEQLAGTLSTMMRDQLDDLSPDDMQEMSAMMPAGMPIDFTAIMSGLSGLIGPLMLVSIAGSTVGQLGSRAFGSYDLPIPRPPSDELLVVATAVDEFGTDWSLPADDLRLCICIDEMAHHATLSIPHVRERLSALLTDHATAFEADPTVLEQQLGPVDLGDPSALESLQETLANPDFMLSALRSPRQHELLPYIDAIVSCVEGYVAWVVRTVGTRLLASYPMVSEALRRRRIETSGQSRFVERLFGLELTQESFDRGVAFVDGLVERGDEAALEALWSDADHLPTPNELAAPGLWLARVGLADDNQPLPELDGEPEIPDFPDLDT